MVMAFAAATKASWGARTRWLDSLDWGRVARVPMGRRATPPGRKDPSEAGAPYLEPVVSLEALREEYGRIPTKQDGSARVWGCKLLCAFARAWW